MLSHSENILQKGYRKCLPLSWQGIFYIHKVNHYKSEGELKSLFV